VSVQFVEAVAICVRGVGDVRVSALRTSPHYARNAQVLLDGRAMSFAVEADDKEGWVEVVDLENPRLIHGDRDRYATKRLVGDVQIIEAP
jgi:hypothetical protein